MLDGGRAPGWPLLMTSATAARFCDMAPRDFRAAVSSGLLPAGRTAKDFLAAGLMTPSQAAALEGMGQIWHRGEIEARSAHLWGLDARTSLAQAHARATAREALDAFELPPRRSPAARQGRQEG